MKIFQKKLKNFSKQQISHSNIFLFFHRVKSSNIYLQNYSYFISNREKKIKFSFFIKAIQKTIDIILIEKIIMIIIIVLLFIIIIFFIFILFFLLKLLIICNT